MSRVAGGLLQLHSEWCCSFVTINRTKADICLLTKKSVNNIMEYFENRKITLFLYINLESFFVCTHF